MEPFVEQLKALCAAHPTRSKWVFVPTHAVGRTLGDRLVLEGTDWANLRFVTPLDVALRMGAPFLVERGIDPSEEGLGPALVMRLLLALPAEGGYFRPLASQPTLAAALWKTIRELRLAGLTSADLRPDAFSSPEKHRELRSLVAAYESFLSDHSRGDQATVYEEAMRHPDWCPIQPQDCWTEQPDVMWSPLQRRLIDAMSGERVAPAALQLPGAIVPRRLAAARVDRQPPDASSPLAFVMDPAGPRPVAADLQVGGAGKAQPQTVAADLQVGGTGKAGPRPVAADLQVGGTANAAPTQGTLFPSPSAESAAPRGPRAEGPGPIRFFHAGGADAELEEVFRRIALSGLSLDQVEIVCASPQYALLVWDKAMRFEWPVTVAQGIPAALTRPGRALLALGTWIEDDFSAGRLRRLLQSGDVRMGDAVEMSAGHAARLLVQSKAAWGRDTYRLALGRLAASSRTRAQREDLGADERDRLDRRAREAGELAAWIGALIADAPAAGPDGTVALQQVVDGARRFVDRFAARASALDNLAAASLADSLDELRALGDFRCSLTEALRFLRERVEALAIAADRPRPGHLHASSLSFAGLAGRSHTFIVGLEEGRVFPQPFEDPILLDDEREAISPLLARSSDRTDEAVYAALSRLAALRADEGAAISLSYSCQDLREYRKTYASWLLLQAYRAVSGNPTAKYSDLHARLGTPKSRVPDAAADAVSEAGWWLYGVTHSGGRGRDAVLEHYPSMAAGLRAAQARQSPEFTEFDGHVPDAGPVLDPRRPDAVISPTQLEDAASCPFRHFLQRGLDVYAIEIGDRDRDVWLDPLLRGSLLHDLYAELLRRRRAENRRVRLPDDEQWLRARGRERLDELAVEMPPPSREVGERESRLLLDDLSLFVNAEAALPPGQTPVGLEVSFGRAGHMDDEPLAQPEPVVVKVGGDTLRVAGRIDRIDRVGPSEYEIIDYKTGGFWPDTWKGTFAAGTRLQHALYTLAALELLKRIDAKARVRGAEYYFPSEKGRQERKPFAAAQLADVGKVLSDLRAVIADGLFIHAYDKEQACKFCHYGHACGQKAFAAAGAKRDDPRLRPFVRLGEYE